MILELLQSYSPDEIINSLEEFLTENKIQKIHSTLVQRLKSIHIAIESPHDLHNAIATFRTCEAFGLLHIHIISEQRRMRGKRTSCGAFHWISVHRHATFEDFLNSLPPDILLSGASPAGEYRISDVPIEQPLCMLFGNEHVGLSKEALGACDFTFNIPMVGMAESLNLSVSCAVSLYDVVSRKRELLNKSGDLSKEEYDREKARCYIRSVGVETASKILNLRCT